MDVVALIPARGGSTGIPRKNLAPLGGKALIRWTIDVALEAETVTRVVVSTDDDEIAAASTGVDVLRRPDALSSDETPMLDVIRHALDALPCEVLVLLQPTSPLRRAEHVDAAVGLLRDTGADAVVSVVPVPHRFAPDSLMDVVGDRLVARTGPMHRQSKQLLYARNGPAVLAVRSATLRDELYGGDVRAYVMGERESLDIDTPFDLELAEALLR